MLSAVRFSLAATVARLKYSFAFVLRLWGSIASASLQKFVNFTHPCLFVCLPVQLVSLVKVSSLEGSVTLLFLLLQGLGFLETINMSVLRFRGRDLTYPIYLLCLHMVWCKA